MAERSALITGAAKRIGRGLALGFAKDGYTVGIHCRQSHNDAEALKNTIREHGGKAEIFIADLQKTRSNRDAHQRRFPKNAESLLPRQ